MLYTILSSDFRIPREFAHDTIENIEMINIAILHMFIIHDKYGRTTNKPISDATRTIARKVRFRNPT
jgi:hypothetical protein